MPEGVDETIQSSEQFLINEDIAILPSTIGLTSTRLAQLKNHTFTGLLLVAISLIIFILIILKSLSIIRFGEAPFLYSYAILLMLFQMSRIISALLYRSHVPRYSKSQVGDNLYQPVVSFVIPCMNEEKVIYQNIKHCFESDYPADKLEVIVINDGSTDQTAKSIEKAKADFQDLKVINFEQNRGKRHAMAAGIKAAKGEIVIQLDSDSYIAGSDVKKLVLPFIDSKIGAVCAHADPSNKDENLLTKAQAGYYFMAFRILKAAESTFHLVLCCSGCCSAYRRSTIMPLVDEFANETFLGVNVSFGDDRALTNLILKNGYKTVYVDDVQAYTIVPNNIRQLLKQQIRWKKSWFINTIKASRFIWKNDSFVASTYFYPLALITLMTPFIAIYSLVVIPLTHHSLPIYFLGGSMLLTLLFATITVLISRNNRHWFYLCVWALINSLILALILPYSILTIRNNKWGTR